MRCLPILISHDPGKACLVEPNHANAVRCLADGLLNVLHIKERFRSIVKMYYRGAAVALLCCDLSGE